MNNIRTAIVCSLGAVATAALIACGGGATPTPTTPPPTSPAPSTTPVHTTPATTRPTPTSTTPTPDSPAATPAPTSPPPIVAAHSDERQCADGTWSYALGRGACSHHGGVRKAGL
jgi:hypothetical protein